MAPVTDIESLLDTEEPEAHYYTWTTRVSRIRRDDTPNPGGIRDDPSKWNEKETAMGTGADSPVHADECKSDGMGIVVSAIERTGDPNVNRTRRRASRNLDAILWTRLQVPLEIKYHNELAGSCGGNREGYSRYSSFVVCASVCHPTVQCPK